MPANDRRITLYRDTTGLAHVAGLRRRQADDAPAAWEWSYGGAGPAELARDILLAAGATAAEADRWHQSFKWALIACLPVRGARLNLDAMRRVVRRLHARPPANPDDCVRRLAAAAAPERLVGVLYGRPSVTRGRTP